DRRDGQRDPRQSAELRARQPGRVAGRVCRAHLARRGRLMLAQPGMAELSILLLGFMVVVLAGGVWIAVTLGLVGLVAMALTTSVPIGSVLATTTWSASASWTL